MQKYVQKKETSNGTFYYIDWGSEYHGRTSFRLWFHYSLVERDDKGNLLLTIPHPGISLTGGKSDRTLILRAGKKNLFDIFVPCGYRGGAQFQILTPVEAVYEYYVYESPKGSLGISKGALVETEQNEITYEWGRTGRLYGAPAKGTTTIFIDGKIEELEGTDLCEIEDLAEV